MNEDEQNRSSPPGDTPLYEPNRCVPRQRVGLLRRFSLKTGIDFAYFGLEPGMVFKGTTGVDKCIISTVG